MPDSHDEFVLRFAGALTEAGMPSMPSRVFAALLGDEDGRMTAAELQEELGVSAGSVSGAVAYLGRVRMLRREREPGGRRDVFVVDDDAWRSAMLSRDQTYAPMIDALRHGEQAVTGPARARVRLAAEFLRFVEADAPEMLQRWEQHKARFLAEGEAPG